MKVYSYQDLADARFILKYKDDKDYQNVPLYDTNFILWAKRVIAFFSRLYKRVKNSIGHYWARLKLAWLEAKNEVTAYNKMLQKNNAKRLGNGNLLLNYIDNSLSYYDRTMNIRGKRSFRTKLRKKADYQQEYKNKTFSSVPNEILTRVSNALAKVKASEPKMSFKELFAV